MKTTRRDFLKAGVTIAGAASGVSAANEIASSSDASAAQSSERTGEALPVAPTASQGDMLYRTLGRTGERVSALGVGGHHLGDLPTVDEAIRLVHEAIDAGITFFENCWEYYNGKTENILGRAIKGRRDKIFLMTKVCTHGRSGQLALQMLEESLRRLGTDHLDLWQIHGIVYDNDPELAYAKGGVLEAFDQAKTQGKVRFVGFTGHKDPAFHLQMLELGYPFDTVQMPLNPFDASFHSFEKQVLPEVNRRGMAALGMKSMGGTAWAVKNGVVKAEELLRYAMSLPVATTISGMDTLEVLHQNLRVVRGFKPMTDNEMDALRARCAPTAADGRYEPYKVSLRYDNPITRLPHGFPVDHTQREVTEMLEKGDGPWLAP
jgi:aryl-alcohol dehydrogenase-like predicted oxidoreductase